MQHDFGAGTGFSFGHFKMLTAEAALSIGSLLDPGDGGVAALVPGVAIVGTDRSDLETFRHQIA